MHHQPAPAPSGNSRGRYIVRTTDVLQDMRVNVYEEASPDKVIWYKERFLDENEIVERVVHNQTSQVCWVIHRPLRGWYIRLRTPAFPPGVFIPLRPLPQQSPYYVDAALSFTSRTSPTPPLHGRPERAPQQRSLTLQDDSSQTSVHSYPPTPTQQLPSSVSTTSGGSVTLGSSTTNNTAQSQITQFILTPSSIPPRSTTTTTTQQQSIFSRALSALKSHHPSHSNSFTLSRIPLNAPLSPPPPYALNLPAAPDASQSTVALTTSTVSSSSPPAAALHSPLVTFHDHTPVLTVRSLTGLLEIDKSEEVLLGVDTSFWVAVALTYLEFLEERESYLAAAND